MKKIILLCAIVIGFCSCSKTVYVNNFASMHITAVDSSPRLLTIMDNNKNILCVDTIVGDVIIVNKIPNAPPQVELGASVSNMMVKSKIKIDVPVVNYTSYLMWLDDNGVVQSRVWELDEYVSVYAIK